MTLRTVTYDTATHKIVPIIPTSEMVHACRLHHEGENYLPYSLYASMTQAAPEYRDSCTDGGKCGAGGYCITCHNVPAPKIGGESC